MFKDQVTEKELIGTKIALLREKIAGKKEHWPIYKTTFDKDGNLEHMETIYNSTGSVRQPSIRNLEELENWANDDFGEWSNYDCTADEVKCWSNQVSIIERF